VSAGLTQSGCRNPISGLIQTSDQVWPIRFPQPRSKGLNGNGWRPYYAIACGFSWIVWAPLAFISLRLFHLFHIQDVSDSIVKQLDKSMWYE
jgi:hypothetical protein